MAAKCPLGTIPCNNNVGCYSWEDLCNGDYKCQDGTDEIAMDCGHTSPSIFTSSPTACSTGGTCLNTDNVKICLTESDMCDGVRQCKEGFDELSCGNPYILPTVVSLAAILVIVLVMCAVYKLCVYRYSSARVNTDQSTSCSTIFLKKHASETRLDIDQLEPSDKSSELSEEERRALREDEEPRCEQCVQYPSEEEEETSVGSGSQWVSTTI